MNTNSPAHDDSQRNSGAGISTRWYYGHEGQAVGPMPFASIEMLVSAGGLPPDVFVVREGGKDWQPLSAILSQSSATEADAHAVQQKSSNAPAASEPSTPQRTKDPTKEIPPIQALLLTAFAFIGLWFYLTKIKPHFEANSDTVSAQSKALPRAESGGRNVPPPMIARDPMRVGSAFTNQPKAKAWVVERGKLGGIDAKNGRPHWLGGFVSHLNDGSISESSASECYYSSDACMSNIVNVLGDFVVCQARGSPLKQTVEFAIRRIDVEANIPPGSDLKSMAYYHLDLSFSGYAHFVGRDEFRTTSGMIRSVPVFEIVKNPPSHKDVLSPFALVLTATAQMVEGKLKLTGKTNLPDHTQFVITTSVPHHPEVEWLNGNVTVKNGQLILDNWNFDSLKRGDYTLMLGLKYDQPLNVEAAIGRHGENLTGEYVRDDASFSVNPEGDGAKTIIYEFKAPISLK